ncbi:Uncharacterized protein PBTT_08997 [Plasmodiophora brassicae]|uniref:Uncharacterized protein n=1 Tax=Plasmodiophora brassicae TaxID=37360 RepID=A0A0G4J8H2_PLABS|nr:hypothetical protein PBRA_009504 [Plasmodiophora brassicae]
MTNNAQRLQEQYDKYCAVVTDRERQRPASQRVKPQSVVHCFTAAQLKLIALDELELVSVDDLTETTLKQWMVDTINDLRDGHGLQPYEMADRLANHVYMNVNLATLRDMIQSVLESLNEHEHRLGYDLRSSVGGRKARVSLFVDAMQPFRLRQHLRRWVTDDKPAREGNIVAVKAEAKRWADAFLLAHKNEANALGNTPKRTVAELRQHDKQHAAGGGRPDTGRAIPAARVDRFKRHRSEPAPAKVAPPPKPSKPISAAAPPAADASKLSRAPTCWHCKGRHTLRDCPTKPSEDECRALVKANARAGPPPIKVKKVQRYPELEGGQQWLVIGDVRVPYELDSGCRGGNIMPSAVASQLREVIFQPVTAREILAADDHAIGSCDQMVKVPVTLETTVGKITLFNVEFYISDAVTVTLIGNDLLAALGISPAQQLSRVVQSGCALVDVDSIQNVEYIVTRMATLTGDQSHNQHPTNDYEPATADVDIGPINVREIEIELNKLVHEARQNGMSRAGLERLRLMLKRHATSGRRERRNPGRRRQEANVRNGRQKASVLALSRPTSVAEVSHSIR